MTKPILIFSITLGIFTLPLPTAFAEGRLAGLSPLAVHVTIVGSTKAKEGERQLTAAVYKTLSDAKIPTIPASDLANEKSPFLHFEFAAQRNAKGHIYLARLSIKIPAVNTYNETPVHASISSGCTIAIVDTKEDVNAAIVAYVGKSLGKFVPAWRGQNATTPVPDMLPEDTPRHGEPSDETERRSQGN